MDHLTLREVLAEESLGLRLVTKAEPEALNRIVMGAHGTEALHPVPWLRRDWILMITGVRLVGRPERQRELVRELAEGSLAALGFGVGIDFDTVPGALLEEAERHDFPIFEIPLATPFREIIAFVNRSLLSDDLHVMRRLTSMREFLVDSLRDEDPQSVIVQRLGSLLDSRAALFSADGRVEADTGEVDADRLWEAVRRARDDGGSAVEHGGRMVLALPVIDRDMPASWLAVAMSGTRSPETYARPLVQTAALLLGGLVGVRRVTRSLERATQAAFIRDLLEEEDGSDSAAVHRASALGLDLEEPARGVVLWLPPSGAELAERALSEAEMVLRAAALPAVLSEREGRIVGFVQTGDDDSLRTALETLEAPLRGLAVGIGRPVSSVSHLRGSLLDAQLALRPPRPRAQRPKAGLHWFEDFDLMTWLIVSADRQALRHKAAGVLGDLRDDEVLMATLESFLDHRLSVVRSAKSLNLHPNSLRYRLARIEERLGRPLDDPDTLATLQISRRLLDR